MKRQGWRLVVLVLVLIGFGAGGVLIAQLRKGRHQLQQFLPPSVDCSSLIRVDRTWTPCGPRQAPSSVDPNQDPQVAANQVNQLAGGFDEYYSWPLGPLDGEFLLMLDMTSVSTYTERIRLSNTASLSVFPSDMPDQVTFIEVQACGGEGEYRWFPPAALTQHQDTQDINLIYEKADFFTLMAGETEALAFQLTCGEPGTYRITISIPCQFSGKSSLILFAEPQELICPKQFTSWWGDPITDEFTPEPFRHAYDCTWADKGYTCVDDKGDPYDW